MAFMYSSAQIVLEFTLSQLTKKKYSKLDYLHYNEKLHTMRVLGPVVINNISFEGVEEHRTR